MVKTRGAVAPLLSHVSAESRLQCMSFPFIRKIFQYDATGKVTGFIERRESWDIVWNKVG